MDRDAALKEVFSADLSEFTATRNDVAARLKESDPTLAAEIKVLRKPSIVVWATNRTAKLNRGLVDELVECAISLRTALADGDSAAARSETQRRRSLIRALSDAATEVLSEAGSKAGPTNLDRISTTFLVAAGDEAAAPLLRAGILREELRSSELSGLDAFAGADPLPPPPKKAQARAREEAKVRLRELEREAARLELEADDAEAFARKARRAATDARAEAERAGGDLAES